MISGISTLREGYIIEQRDYKEAHSHYTAALAIFQTLGEPANEATIWLRLGIMAGEQEQWADAERYFRESLMLVERMGDTASTAHICNNLATVAQQAGRPNEAEGWYKRALELYGRVQSSDHEEAGVLSNLAALLTNEIRAGRIPTTRLAEARGYAQRALAAVEALPTSPEVWLTLSILADIAAMEGRLEEARAYRRREQETHAAFAGNRYRINRQHGKLIAAIAAAATGDKQARGAVEVVLPQLEAKGWHIAAATRRIWKGERDWQALVVDLDGASALLVLRVLETLRQDVQEE